jgi:hypothetical protein
VCEGSLEGSFLHFLCHSARLVWAGAGAAPAPATEDEALPEDEGPDHSQSHLQLYLSILLGVLIAAAPELAPLAAEIVHTARVAREMAGGLDFYAQHGAIEAGSVAALRAVIARLETA